MLNCLIVLFCGLWVTHKALCIYCEQSSSVFVFIKHADENVWANLRHGFGSPRGIFTSTLPASGHHLVSGEEKLSNVHKASPQSIHKGSNSTAVSHIRGICTMTQQEINCLSFPMESCNSKIGYTELFFRFTQSKQQILLGLSSAVILLQLFTYFLNIACSDRKVTTMMALVFFQTGVTPSMWWNNQCNQSDTQLSMLLLLYY